MFGNGVRITISTDIIRHAKTWARSQIQQGLVRVKAEFCAAGRFSTTRNAALHFATMPARTSETFTADFVLPGASNAGAPKNLLLNKIEDKDTVCIREGASKQCVSRPTASRSRGARIATNWKAAGFRQNVQQTDPECVMRCRMSVEILRRAARDLRFK